MINLTFIVNEIKSLIKKYKLDNYFYIIKLNPQLKQSNHIPGHYNMFIGNEFIEIILIFLAKLFDKRRTTNET